MKLAEFYNGIEIHREDKIIYVLLKTPHRVLSTCRSSMGGMHDDLRFVYNHQSCEPVGDHMNGRMHKAIENPDEYKKEVANRYSLPFQSCATLGTAANMNNAAICHESFSDLEVVTVCTGGVERNAGRAGDPASYHEPLKDLPINDSPLNDSPLNDSPLNDSPLNEDLITSQKDEEIQGPGTINAMIFINRELTPGAMVTAVITATEAKTAALLELEVPSRYSEGLATGTGTDQIAVASKLGGNAMAYAGKHSKLGELIGRTVHDAVKKTLSLQNGLTPAGQCSATAHLERLGIDDQGLCIGVEQFLSKSDADLFKGNFSNIIKDPITVAAVAALVHLRDKIIYGILPDSCIPEVMNIYGAQISAAISGKNYRYLAYMQMLSSSKMSIEKRSFLEFVFRAFALGFSEKWVDVKSDACK